MKKVVIFDLDHYLVEINTSYEAVKYVLKRERKFLKLLFLYFQRIIIPCLIFFLPSKSDREFYLKLLKGFNKSVLKNHTDEFFLYVIKNFLNNNLYQEANKFKEKKDYILILASSSFDLIVKAIAEKLKFDFSLGSIIEFDRNNICTGNLKTKLDGKKLEFLQQETFPLIGEIDFCNSYLYTDNFSDITLAKIIGNPFGIVKYSKEAKWWSLNNIPVIYKIPERKSYNFLFMPGLYYFIIRFPTNLVGNIYYHLFFPFIFSVLILPFSFKNFLILLLSFWGYISLYEIGYIINDCISVKKEENPSIRINPNSIFCRKINLAVVSRAIFFLGVFLLLVYLISGMPFVYFISNLLILSIFLIVNNWNQQYRKFLYPFLASSHLVIPPLIFNPPFYFLLPIIIFNFIWHFIYAFSEKIITQPKEKAILIFLPKILILFLFIGFYYFRPDPMNFKILLLSFLLCTFDIFYLFKFCLTQLDNRLIKL